ncbi:MAG: peptidoglycan DD-metalloendopeptidase family protein [Salinisphaera sp.]|jgi:murein DD-endopeptidase MepM/ murein hydrolase activator NlpD|nr:peptidoglycan DD-metalloendopeptidase family protein [Salinisphaera sp.]
MHHRQVLRASAAGALGVSLIFCSSAQSATSATHDTSARFDAAFKLTNDVSRHSATGDKGRVDSTQITRWQTLAVASGDSLSQLFAKAGLGASQWMELLKLKDKTKSLRSLQPGDQIDIRKTMDGRLAELRYQIDPLHTLTVNRVGSQLTAQIQKVSTQKRELTASGTISRSLARSLARQGIPSRIASQLSSIYRYRHNLRRLHPGDHFAVVYQAEYIDQKQVALGPILAASITSDHHNYKAFRAKDVDGKFAYYDTSGQSYQPSFTRKPVAYTRISSPFNLHRMNPVLHVVRPHEGVDMAAPMGTPIHAAANGTVKYAGWAHGYGRLVELNNFSGYSTRYGHMHRLAKGLHVGQPVHKGQVIGYVGESGEATGPHLHFEVRIHDVAYNPLTVKLPGGQPLPASQLASYTRNIQPLIAKLEPVPKTLVARTDSAPVSTNNRCTGNISLHTTLAIDPIGAADRKATTRIFCVVRHQATNA